MGRLGLQALNNARIGIMLHKVSGNTS